MAQWIKDETAGAQDRPEGMGDPLGRPGIPVPPTGVGTLDKCVAVLVAVRAGAATVAQVSAETGLSRPTVHRLVAALDAHQLLKRRPGDGLGIGSLATVLAAETASEMMVACAEPWLAHLRDSMGETAQLFRRVGDERLCAAAATGNGRLRDSVGVGDLLPMTAGSAAEVLVAWDVETPGGLPEGALFDVADLSAVRRRGWAETVGQRDAGLASVSAPVRWRGEVIGALCVAGPLHRVGHHPAQQWGPLVAAAASALGLRIAQVMGEDSAPRS